MLASLCFPRCPFVVLLAAAAAAPPAAAAAPFEAPAAARATTALESARHDYVASRFEACAVTMAAAEAELATELRTAADLALMKRVNQWWGLCSAASGARPQAAAAFARAARLPGPEPEADVFSPPLLEQYRVAARPRGTCLWQDAARDVALEGAAPGTTVEEGEHYLVSGSHSARLVVEPGAGGSCVIRWPTGARFVPWPAPAIPAPPPIVSATLPPPPAPAPEPSKPWYRRGWVWGAVAVVAAGAATAIVLGSRGGQGGSPQPGERRYDVSF